MPSSLQVVFDKWIPLRGNNYHIKLFMLAIVLWSLWNVRNKMGIEKKFPKSSSNKVFLQKIWFCSEVAGSFEGARCQALERQGKADEKLDDELLEANLRLGSGRGD